MFAFLMIVYPLISLIIPQTPARFYNVLYYVNCPQRCVYVMPFGSNIAVVRCGWDFGILLENLLFVILKPLG